MEEKFIRSAISVNESSFCRSRRVISCMVKRSIQQEAGSPLIFLQISER